MREEHDVMSTCLGMHLKINSFPRANCSLLVLCQPLYFHKPHFNHHAISYNHSCCCSCLSSRCAAEMGHYLMARPFMAYQDLVCQFHNQHFNYSSTSPAT